MRKLLLMVCALFGFMACTQNPIEEQSAIRTDAPETIRVGFEDDETRIQLNEAQKTVWTKGDQVSVFYKSDANQKWEYRGETGERVAELYRVDAGTASSKMNYVVLAYPYSTDYVLSTASGNIESTLPATQHYAEGSYGVGNNLMVSQSEFTQFSLKSVCGWLKLQLTGDGEVVKSIKFRGNDGEQVAGLIYVDTATAEATLASEMGSSDDNNAGGNLVFDDTILTEVVLDCGEGVELGAEATSFYITLPPQTFANGFTVDIECKEYKLMTLTTEKELVIERNHIQPMASVEHNAVQIIPNNEIWYTNGSTTEVTTPYRTNAFGANIVSNTYDAAKECWVIKFDGEATTIGELAFAECSSLTSVTIPDSVTSIGYAAFGWCNSLTSVIIPDSITTIGDYAFYGCSSLTSTTIPDSVTTIGNYAFGWCNSLTSVTIPDSVTSIGSSAFEYCKSLTSVTIGNGVTTIGKHTFKGCSSLTSVTIGDSVTTIGDYTFNGCISLESVTIPDSVTTIGYAAFAECSSLTSVTIGDSVTEIGDYAFNSCSNLTSVTIPDSVTEIGYAAFAYCSSLKSVTIPDSVTTIGGDVFSSCGSLQEFNGKFTSEDGRCWIIDGTLNAFAPAGLTEYTIPNSVTTIGAMAFSSCSSLTSVTIPDSVTTIGEGAFYWCESLTSVYCKATTPPAALSYDGYWHAFYNNAPDRKIYVPMESVEAYKSASGWSDYASAIIGYNFENGVAGTPKPANNEIWYTNGSTTTATTPCQTGAFGSAKIQSNTYNNTLKKWVIKFDEDVTKIDNDAFSFIENITSITIPDSVISISGNAFADCPNLEKFIGKFAEDNGRCIVIDNTIIEYAEGSGDEYKIPNDVTKIGAYALSWCENLKSIIIPNSVTEVGAYAFAYCSSLTSATIGNRVTVIKSSAFYNCSSLQSINIPNSVTKIEVLAFQNCTNLTEVYCSALTPPTGGSEMFKNNASGRKIYVPMESVEAYKSASYWSKYADDIVGYNF